MPDKYPALSKALEGIQIDKFGSDLSDYFPQRINLNSRLSAYNSPTRNSKSFWIHRGILQGAFPPIGTQPIYTVPSGFTLMITEWGFRSDDGASATSFSLATSEVSHSEHMHPWDVSLLGLINFVFPDGWVDSGGRIVRLMKCRIIVRENVTFLFAWPGFGVPCTGEFEIRGWLIPDTEMRGIEGRKR